MEFQSLAQGGMGVRMAALGSFATNCYVIKCLKTGQGAIIDSSAQGEVIDRMVAHDGGVKVGQLLQTHAHVDHVAALNHTYKTYKAPIALHASDGMLYKAAPLQGGMFGIMIAPLPTPEVELKEGDEVTVGELRAKVLWTPGHTPGSVCFYFEAQKVLFAGDVLFAGSIGRTDLPGGNMKEMMKSLARLVTLPDDTLVLSGHGPETTIGREKRTNPFLTR